MNSHPMHFCQMVKECGSFRHLDIANLALLSFRSNESFVNLTPEVSPGHVEHKFILCRECDVTIVTLIW